MEMNKIEMKSRGSTGRGGHGRRGGVPRQVLHRLADVGRHARRGPAIEGGGAWRSGSDDADGGSRGNNKTVHEKRKYLEINARVRWSPRAPRGCLHHARGTIDSSFVTHGSRDPRRPRPSRAEVWEAVAFSSERC